MSSLNYYKTLDVSPAASGSDIKRSFRRLAKEVHPDTGDTAGGSRIRLLIRAYEVLSDPRKRDIYDRTHAGLFRETSFDYREFLRSQSTNYVSQSRLIFYDLLHFYEEEALSVYDQLLSLKIDLRKYMPRDEFMDCFFLLAEALERRGDLVRSAELYRRIYAYECEQPYFRHFIEEVIDRLRSLVCIRMASVLPAPVVIANIQYLIELNFSSKDSALFHKRIAEVYSNNCNNNMAAIHLRRGLELDEKLTGIKKLKQRIGYH